MSDTNERLDRNNGLLLTPSADVLFDHGWIAFRDNGNVLVSRRLPDAIHEKAGLDLSSGRDCGEFTLEQRASWNITVTACMSMRGTRIGLVTSCVTSGAASARRSTLASARHRRPTYVRSTLFAMTTTEPDASSLRKFGRPLGFKAYAGLLAEAV